MLSALPRKSTLRLSGSRDACCKSRLYAYTPCTSSTTDDTQLQHDPLGARPSKVCRVGLLATAYLLGKSSLSYAATETIVWAFKIDSQETRIIICELAIHASSSVLQDDKDTPPDREIGDRDADLKSACPACSPGPSQRVLRNEEL